MDLTGDDHRVDHVAAVVDGVILKDLHVAGVGVDLDHGQVGAEGPGGVAGAEHGLGLETRGHPFGEGMGLIGRLGDGRPLHALLRRSCDMGAAVGEHDVVRRCLEDVGRDLGCLLLHLRRRLIGGGAVDRDRAAAEGADPHRVVAGVAVVDPDVLDRDTETITDDLCPCGLMTLACGPGPDHHGGRRIGIDPNQAGSVERGGEAV